ncbi:MAG: glycogen/starch/alpha-glucan phosphorylase [SAR324 cluster bacterium]|nr:glycogen/starch/alpha-glucan phosphorylase [SAR324 cluster bacterium]
MTSRNKSNNIWKFVDDYLKMDETALAKSIAHHLEFSVCKNRRTLKKIDIFESLALAIRDRQVELWNDTQQSYYESDCKQVYYLSLEYLMGRSLRNNLINLDLADVCRKVMEENGYDLADIEELESDAGLGNGGLGRLAACFLDSMATLELPASGYGIRYEYGIFEQKIENEAQVEYPDNWLAQGYPWEIQVFDETHSVKFYGHVREEIDQKGRKSYHWEDTQDVLALPYDVPIAGYQTRTVNTLRLWQAKPSKDFDFALFNEGDYMRSVEEKQKSETISKVLYPNDKNFSGKELRLKQQYFFVCASLKDIIRRYKVNHQSFDKFADKIAIQLNDTHPSIAIPELMRILMDEEGLDWDAAWTITIRVFAYTNHTVLPEALEKWPVGMMGHLLPRHLQIIYDINDQFLDEVKERYPGDLDILGRMSLIEEGFGKQVRMHHLAFVGSHAINGVAALHTELLKKTIFRDFYAMYPERFQNKTNGITHRRWLLGCNPELSELITKKIGKGWIKSPEELKNLIPFANEPRFQKDWYKVKQTKKEQFCKWLQREQGIEIKANSLFDVQIKRIHEYKRQLLNVLHIIALHNRILANPNAAFVPRTVILGGKAAPGYYMAKLIVQLANDVARVVNNHPQIGDRLKVVFLENYRVSLAEKIIPATDISQHISTAGTEASGTSNMKFSLNGSLIIGTMDGATIEIREEVGEDNIFIFGMTDDEVKKKQKAGYNPRVCYQNTLELREILEMINTGYFNRDDPHLYNDIYNTLIYDDTYMLLADFSSYLSCQEKVGQTYLDQETWTRMSILNTANMAKFSTDRTIAEYARDIWQIEPMNVRPIGTKIR